jgi:hypothetical protein
MPAGEAKSWTTLAADRLAHDLKLSPAERDTVHQLIAKRGDEISRDRRRAHFQIFLRVLAAYRDVESILPETRRADIVRHRLRLIREIREKFPDIIKDNPSPDLVVAP